MTRLLARTGAAVLDSGPVLVLAGIAAAGSFTHIRDTAAQHGQDGPMALAVAVCIDLTCVMAARERQRDKSHGRKVGRLSWPTLVLTGGVVLSLAANLAQAQPTAWGYVTAGTPAAAFLVAVSMLERRAALAATRNADGTAPGGPHTNSPAKTSAVETEPVGSSSVGPAIEAQPVPASAPAPVPASADPAPAAPENGARPTASLLEFARHLADQHQRTHGRPITPDALRTRLGVTPSTGRPAARPAPHPQRPPPHRPPLRRN